MGLYYVAGWPYSDELYHFGIKGQKWGIRRFENPDGTLTPAGKERYRYLKSDLKNKTDVYDEAVRQYDRSVNARNAYKVARKAREEYGKVKYERIKNEYKNYGKRRNIKKNEFNVKQTEWERDKAENRLREFQGFAPKKISTLSPKSKKIGKKIAKTVIGTTAGVSLATLGLAGGATYVVGTAAIENKEIAQAVLTFLELNHIITR